MGFIRPEREQQILFGYSLDEFVPADALCRFVVDLVSRLDLRAVYADYSDQGGDAFDPAMMLSTWFLAYAEGETSTRELEQHCRRDMHFIYVSGNLKPDHTSLSRFRQRHWRGSRICSWPSCVWPGRRASPNSGPSASTAHASRPTPARAGA